MNTGTHRDTRRVRRVRLVGLDDPGYRAHCSQHALRARRLGIRGAPSFSCQAALVFERIVRRRLKRICPLRAARVLAYEIQDGRYGYRPEYLELDAVSGSIGAELRLYEIKATSARGRALRGLRQLRRARNLAATRGGNVSVVDIWVDTNGGPSQSREAVQTSNLTELENLEALARWEVEEDRPAFIRIHGNEAWSWAGEEGIAVDDDVWRQAQHELQVARQIRESRRMLKEAGIPPDEWPTETRVRERRRGRGVYGTAPGNPPATTLSAAFKSALERQNR